MEYSARLAADDPRHFELIVTALDLHEERRYDFAVIAAQIASEIYLELSTAQILEWRQLGPLGNVIVDDLVRKYTFTDGRFQALWEALTGDDKAALREQDWWTAYTTSRTLRDTIVHRGHRATKDESGHAIMAAIGASGYVQNMFIRIGLELGALREKLGTAADGLAGTRRVPN